MSCIHPVSLNVSACIDKCCTLVPPSKTACWFMYKIFAHSEFYSSAFLNLEILGDKIEHSCNNSQSFVTKATMMCYTKNLHRWHNFTFITNYIWLYSQQYCNSTDCENSSQSLFFGGGGLLFFPMLNTIINSPLSQRWLPTDLFSWI
jgi:hypothetical protein